MSQHLPARRRKGSLDLYSAGKVSGDGEAEDKDSLEKWVKQHSERQVQQRVESASVSDDHEMTYQGPGNFLTQPIQEPSDFEDEEEEDEPEVEMVGEEKKEEVRVVDAESNSEYNVDEVINDDKGGDDGNQVLE